MNRRFPNLPPSGDLPPEVLDELLRAFAADPDQADQHRDIDLSSPEIAELLQPSDPDGDTRPPAEQHPTESVAQTRQSPPSTGPATAVAGADPSGNESAGIGPADPDPSVTPATTVMPSLAPAAAPFDGGDDSLPATTLGPAADPAAGGPPILESNPDAPAADAPAPEAPATEAPAAEAWAGAVAEPAADLAASPAGSPAGAAPVEPAPAAAPDRIVISDWDDSSTFDRPADAVAAGAAGPSGGVGAEAPADAGPIVIADDGLPDAVYLESGDDSASNTIRIADDTSHDTVSLETAAAATRIEPRMRDRRNAVRRHRVRKRLVWAGFVAGLVVAVVAVVAVLGSGLFAVDNVHVEGVERTELADVQAVVDELEGTPTLRVDTDALEKQLERSPWVDSVRITTDFPHDATIEISERTPVAAFAGPDGQWRVIDDEGRVLQVVETQPAEYLPIVVDNTPTVTAGQFMGDSYRAAATLVKSLTPTVRPLVTGVAASDDNSNLRMTLTNGTEVRFGEGRDLLAKLIRLESEIGDVVEDNPSVIDVSTAEITVS